MKETCRVGNGWRRWLDESWPGDFFLKHRQGELINVRYVHQAAPWWCFIGQMVEVTNFIGGTRPGQRYKKTMENHHVFHGKINYKWPCSIAILTNYQRVQYPGFAMFDYQMVCWLTTPVSSWWEKRLTVSSWRKIWVTHRIHVWHIYIYIY